MFVPVLRLTTLIVLVALTVSACSGKKPPVARPTPPPPTAGGTPPPAPPPLPEPEPSLGSVPLEPSMRGADLADYNARSLDEINRESPLEPVFYGYDSSEMTPENRAVLERNADVLRRYANWVVTIEGHCDDRGTAEYNLSLGERRAQSARAYLVSLGIPTDRLRTVSYGKEFPFDPGSNEEAWAKNRRAHFVVTSK
jgi:peptidoglycan-associated lipoprotein